MNTPMQPEWERKTRLLTHLLIWSGAVNIGLLSSLLYVVFRENPAELTFERQPLPPSRYKSLHATNHEMLAVFANLSWPELIAELETLDFVEEGYRKRDLALASMVAFHGFDIQRALQGTLVQKRVIAFKRKGSPEEVVLTLYPGLNDDQFQAVQRFIQTEKFPFTAQGLFYEIQHQAPPRDPTLLQAFYLTAEFNAIWTLFQRMGIHLPRDFLIEMVAQGDWKTLHQFSEEQKKVLDLSPDQLKTVLLSYLRCHSLFAAKILLQWDREFILKRLEDRDLIALMDLFKEPSPLFETLLKELLLSSRADPVLKKAAERLYLFAHLPFPQPYDHAATIALFVRGEKRASSDPSPSQTPPPLQKYLIQRGDNLWKIARKHHVSVDALRRANQLESDRLREGRELLIPSRGEAPTPQD